MPKRTKPASVRRISLRAPAHEERLIREVAAMEGTSITEFILQSARTRAQQVLTDQSHFSVSREVWEKFNEALDRPAQFKPRLHRLVTEPSILER